MVALGWRQAVGRGPLETGVTAAANGLKTLVSTRPAERPATAAAEQLGRHRIPSLQPATENGSAVAGGLSGRSGAAGRDRLVGLDVTRGLALLGMIAVHALVPYDENFEPNWVTFGPTGHASAIFAVLAGVGLSLTTGRERVPWWNAGPAAAALLGRAAAIGVVGLALGYADAGVTGVILVYYAVLFVLAIPVVLLPTRWVVVVGVCAAVAVPVLSQVVRSGLGEVEGRNPSFGALFSDPGGLLSELLWTGLYPALPWMAYVCAGLVVGRLRLSTARVAWSLVAVGLTLATLAAEAASVLLDDLGGRAALLLAGTGDDRSVDELLAYGFDGTTPTTSWWWLATDAPHAGTPLDLIGTTGVALAILGGMLLLDHLGSPLWGIVSAVTAPLAAAGAMALTLYTAHVVFMNSPLDVFDLVPGYLAQVLAALVIALVWRRSVGRGPLESAVTAVARRFRGWAVAARPPARVPDRLPPGAGRHRVE